MFGAKGLFRGPVMFGLIHDERIYLKTSEQARKVFLREGSGPFTFHTKGGKQILTSYYALPERLYDEPDELADWARAAVTAALDSPSARKKRRLVKKERQR